MTDDDVQLPVGFHVRIAKGGPDQAVGGLGRLVGLTVVERLTGEHLQRVAAGSRLADLVARWDAFFATKKAAVQR